MEARYLNCWMSLHNRSIDFFPPKPCIRRGFPSAIAPLIPRALSLGGFLTRYLLLLLLLLSWTGATRHPIILHNKHSRGQEERAVCAFTERHINMHHCTNYNVHLCRLNTLRLSKGRARFKKYDSNGGMEIQTYSIYTAFDHRC